MCGMQSYYRYGETINPDVWFEPTEVIAFTFHTFALLQNFLILFLVLSLLGLSRFLLIILIIVKGS